MPSGAVTVTVDFPSRGRYVPPYAESVRVQVVGTNRTGIINRSGNNASTQTVLVSGVPIGQQVLQVSAHSQANAQGTTVATAAIGITVVEGQNLPVNVSANLQSTIQSLTITPLPISLEVGEQLQLTATARDSGNNVLLLPGSALSWSIPVGGNACSVSTSGMLTGLESGPATVRVAEVGGVIQTDESVSVLTSNRVFFQTDRAGPDAVWSMRQDGTGLRSVASPGWVPIANRLGTRLVFTRSIPGPGNSFLEEIYSCNIDGSMQQRQTFSQDSGTSNADNVAIAFAPNGLDVLIFRNFPGGRAISILSTVTSVVTDIVISSPGTGGTELTFDGMGGGVSPDGQFIYYVATGTGLNGVGPQIFRMRIDGTDKTQVLQTQRPYGLGVSPDGTKLVFCTEPGDPLDLYTCNTDGTGFQLVATLPGTELVPKFTEDGLHVVFASNREGQFEIYRIKFDGTDLTRVTDHSARDVSPSVAWGN